MTIRHKSSNVSQFTFCQSSTKMKTDVYGDFGLRNYQYLSSPYLPVWMVRCRPRQLALWGSELLNSGFRSESPNMSSSGPDHMKSAPYHTELSVRGKLKTEILSVYMEAPRKQTKKNFTQIWLSSK
jgi:hypothetical protein